MVVVEQAGAVERMLHPHKPRTRRPAARIRGRTNQFTAETKAGVDHPAEIWFNEPVRELSFRTDKYDLNYTLLHLGNILRGPWLAEVHVEDTFDRFNGGAAR